MAKKRIIKDYETLPEDIIRMVKMKYPTGYAASLISYTDKEGKKVSALPFETEETYYLIRMTIQDAKRIVKEDEDFDDEGVLRGDFSDIDVDSEFDGAGEDGDDAADVSGGADEDDHIIVTRRRDNDDVHDIADDSDY